MGLGESMAGRFLMFNALILSFQEVKIQRNPNCLLCGENPSIMELIQYPQACEGSAAA